jgi:hypothetical protein
MLFLHHLWENTVSGAVPTFVDFAYCVDIMADIADGVMETDNTDCFVSSGSVLFTHIANRIQSFLAAEGFKEDSPSPKSSCNGSDDDVTFYFAMSHPDTEEDKVQEI